MIDRKTAIKALKNDMFLFFRKQCIFKDKQGKITTFIPNETQLIVHNEAEQQLKKQGKVRLVILKGRQQGCSTYIRMRFLNKILYNKGLTAFIMVHLHDAGKKFFARVRDTYNKIDKDLKPSFLKNNESILELNPMMMSSISFGTAGSEGAGRSDTLQLLHCSEVSFWDNASDHMKGLMQALADVEGTECFMESTADGMTGDAEEFYNKFQYGLDPLSEFKSLFIPWFTNSEYQKIIPADFELKTFRDYCEKEYKAKYGLNDAQIFWMRNKIFTDFNGRYSFWCSEYPAYPDEAFEGTGENSFIESHVVAEARKRQPKNLKKEIALGIDVGGDETRKDPDRTCFALRDGNDFKILGEYKGLSKERFLNIAVDFIKMYNPHKIRVDVTGMVFNVVTEIVNLCRIRGVPVADIKGVNFGESALDHVKFVNVRAEMFYHLREHLLIGSCDDSANLQKDLTALGYKKDKTGRLQMEAKKNLTESPDLADACALTCHQSRDFNIRIV